VARVIVQELPEASDESRQESRFRKLKLNRLPLTKTAHTNVTDNLRRAAGFFIFCDFQPSEPCSNAGRGRCENRVDDGSCIDPFGVPEGCAKFAAQLNPVRRCRLSGGETHITPAGDSLPSS
jgi:hypothetical protein